MHVLSTIFSLVYIYLIVQVLSESVSKALTLTGGEEARETSRLVDYMDKFFDALNVSNYTKGVHKRKPFQLPYTTSEDKCLEVY